MSSKRTRGIASAAAEGSSIDIRKEYLLKFHRSCRPSPDVGDNEHQSLRARLQRININSNKSSLTILDVPIEAMKHIAAFLPAPSQAILAISFELSRNETQDFVMGNNWRTLDFGEIEKSLAEKLTDADVRSILLCIDSVRKVRKLRMTNCINITGFGLEPLRGSRIMEHIDLSLVPDHTSPSLYPEPPLSQIFVLPILATFMGRKLKLIEFPKAWRVEKGFDMDEEENNDYYHFLDNFVLSMNNGRGFRCKECQLEIPPNFSDECEGTQRYVCYKCYDCYCDECDWNVELMFCDKCERHYCDDCVEHRTCLLCDKAYCTECATFTFCQDCNVCVCSNCVTEESCKQCNKTVRMCTCGACYDDERDELSRDHVNECAYCTDIFCDECVKSGCLSECHNCNRYHCCGCVKTQNLHSCSEHKFCEGTTRGDFSSYCRKCRFNSIGYHCEKCYLDVCPDLLKKHLTAVEEIDKLRKENASLTMKLQHAKDNVAVAENDVEIVMSQAGCSRAKAIKALVDSDNDTVEAIMSLV